LVVAGNLLQNGSYPLQPHAGVYAGPGKWRLGPLGIAIVLHKDQVPQLQEPVTIAPRSAGRLTTACFFSLIDKDLGTGSAGTCFTHGPKIVLFTHFDNAVHGKANAFIPDGEGFFVILIDGDPELLSDNKRLLERIGALTIETNYQIELAEHMSQVLASGLEVMQSIYNNQLQLLSNRLALLVAYLTILGTAVLVPNTVATIFGVPFFDFGPDFLPYYELIIVASTIISVLAAYLWVRLSGLLPKSPAQP